jgi:hypothetical protein
LECGIKPARQENADCGLRNEIRWNDLRLSFSCNDLAL